MLELKIYNRDGKELKSYELNGVRPIRIGRGVDCEIQIGVPEVSRKHAELEQVEDDVWIIRDLNSRHGCHVNGERFRELTITAGLEVTIGPAILRFEDTNARIGAEINAMIADEDDAAAHAPTAIADADTVARAGSRPRSAPAEGPADQPKKRWGLSMFKKKP